MDVISLIVAIAAIILGVIFLFLMFFISGDPGPKGAVGAQGFQGNAYTGTGDGTVGFQGAQGVQGLIGDQGAQGFTGKNDSTQTFRQEIVDYGGGTEKTVAPTMSTVYTLTNLSNTATTILNLSFNSTMKQGAILVINLNGNIGDEGKRKVEIRSSGFFRFKKGSENGTVVPLDYFRDTNAVPNSSYMLTLGPNNTFLITSSEPY